jgi:hypothetical protein
MAGRISKRRSIDVDNLVWNRKETKVQADSENDKKDGRVCITLVGRNIVSGMVGDEWS